MGQWNVSEKYFAKPKLCDQRNITSCTYLYHLKPFFNKVKKVGYKNFTFSGKKCMQFQSSLLNWLNEFNRLYMF